MTPGYIILASIAVILLFAALKLLGVIALSWWWLGVPALAFLVALAFVGVIIYAVTSGP